MPADLSLDYKIHDLVINGYTAKEIASILGRNQVVVSRDCQRMMLVPQRVSTRPPYGLTNESLPLRMILAGLLVDMQQNGALTPQISEFTGLNQREIGRAINRPYHHDWTLTQMERTLQHFGKTLRDYV